MGLYADIIGTLRETFRLGRQTLATAATAARTATFPDKSGTLAMLSDVGSIQLVERQEVTGSAVTSITFSGLDLAVDGTYFIRFGFKNASAGARTVAMYANGDTTTTNYYRQRLGLSNTTVSGVRQNVATIANIFASSFTAGRIMMFKPASGDVPRANVEGQEGNGTAGASTVEAEWIFWAWTSAVNVTSLTFTIDAASAFAIGSYVEIYRLTPQPQDLRNVKITRGAEFANNKLTLVAADADVVYTYCPFDGTITKAIAYGTPGGSCVFDVYKGAYGSTASIVASQPPTLIVDDYMENSTLAGWTTSVTAGEWIGIKLVSSSAQIVAGCVLEITPS